MNKKFEERARILLLSLREKNNLSIKEATDLLGISEATARRLFTYLQKDGKLVRTHGGVRYIKDRVCDYSFDVLQNMRTEEKNRIAELALRLIENGDVIFLDSGTTLLSLCDKLYECIRKSEIKDITVFTNSIENMQVLSPLCKVILTGGEYRHKRRDFAGFASEKMLQNFRFKQCFLGADGVDTLDGFMATDLDTAHLSELVISRSEKTNILLDSIKFSRPSLITFARFKDVQRIITDKNVSPEMREQLKAQNITLIYE